jgi:bifunctional non-homologous end joining protein LigD
MASPAGAKERGQAGTCVLTNPRGLARKVPVGDGWIHELKHDGFRMLAFKDGDSVRLWPRNGRDWSAEFVAITEAVRALPSSASC